MIYLDYGSCRALEGTISFQIESQVENAPLGLVL